MKMVGKPDARDPHVRFEEGGGPIGPSLLDGSPLRKRLVALANRDVHVQAQEHEHSQHVCRSSHSDTL